MANEDFWQRNGAVMATLAGVAFVAVAAIFVWVAFLAPPRADQPTPSPTAVAPTSPTPSPDATPVASPAPSPAGTASPAPTPEPSPSPTVAPRPSPPPPASPSPNPAGWIEVTDFPTYRGSTHVESIVAGGPGFVAVGSGGQQQRGRVWTSPDGLAWRAAPDEQFIGYSLTRVLSLGDRLLLYGTDRTGRNVWMSTDGLTWSDLGRPVGLAGAGINDIVVVGSALVAIGFTEDPDYVGAVWRSSDGVDWQRAAAPATVELTAAAAMGNTLVGVDRFSFGSPAVYYSTDLGESWQAAQTDFAADEDTSVGLVSIAADGRRFVAVGYGDTYDYPPISARSGDGRSWTSREPAGYNLLGQIVALDGGGFVAFEGDGNRVLLSANGRDWTPVAALHADRPAPPTPPEPGDEVVTFRQVAASRSGVVVAQEWGNDVVVWFAPASLFAR